jgi:magnesium transporter
MEESSQTPNTEAVETPLHALLVAWPALEATDRKARFFALPRTDAEELFLAIKADDQWDLIRDLSTNEKRSWMRLLAPDDAADLVQQCDPDMRQELLRVLDDDTRMDVLALMAYAEDDAGGLMNPRFIRLRPDVTADVAIRYLRAQTKKKPHFAHYAYVLDHDQKLRGVLSVRELLVAAPDELIRDLMRTEVLTLPVGMDQEDVSRKFSHFNLSALPVIDAEGRMMGVVTADDVVDVVEEEATEDIQKLGGSEALDAPYMQMGFLPMVKKRAGWLTILFLGEMLTATAMGYFQKEIERAVVLALFIPLIISSGGNSGSQATSLIIRALALREIRLKDWWRVLGRELAAGVTLGLILASIGFVRILLWPAREEIYGEHYVLVAFTVAGALVGVVLWGSIIGSMLPFILRRVGFDPAAASAPFVATLVDVTGLIIYFSVASVIMHGTLL